MASNELPANGLPPNVEVPEEFDFKLYRFTPSLEGAIIAAIVFGLLTAVHSWRLVRARSFYFTPFLIGGVCTSRPCALSRNCCSGQPVLTELGPQSRP